ncbi:hypothetical protein CL614_05285 [archaeon]|nr:hypothetical protein [archaeon]|tara:strand:+ start:770 stop:1021 length:252 start_codon:yes stop_codon:yes gene_type:complete
MSVFEMILESFDIRKLNTICNEKSCNSIPTKKIDLYQYEMRKGKKILASLHICDSHFRDVVKIVELIKEKNPKVIVDKDVIEL